MSTAELLPRSVWITKYVLTEGITLRQATIDEDGNAFIEVPGRSVRMFVRAVDVHCSFSSALARAEVMRAQRIASLRRQIAKLEALTLGDIAASSVPDDAEAADALADAPDATHAADADPVAAMVEIDRLLSRSGPYDG